MQSSKVDDHPLTLDHVMGIINHFKVLKANHKNKRLAIEISVVLMVKILLLWLIWMLFFSHPIAKEARQEAVTRIILNQTH